MADKFDVLSFTQAHPEQWVSVAEIRSAIADLPPDRTLRRWLGALVLSGALERRGERKGTRYRGRSGSTSSRDAAEAQIAAPQHPSTPQAPQLTFSPASAALVKRITAPIYTRPPATYSEEWLEQYVPNESAYLPEQERSALQALGKRAPIYGRAGTYIQKIYNRLLIDFSYNSARLEGNTYTLADTERLLLHGAAAEGKPNAERIMILNHKEAIRHLVQHVDTLTADEETIRTVHYLLADSLVAPGAAGQIRDESILVSGTTYAPLDGRDRLTRLLLRVLEKARDIADPFEQSFFLLAHISYLQAFVDVNKRTARLASIIPLIRADCVPQSFVDVDRDQYLKTTIALYELREVGPLAEVYSWSYRRTCQRYDVSVQAIGFDEIAALYRPQRRALVADLVRSKVPPDQVTAWLTQHIPRVIGPQHREKFLADVVAELEQLAVSRIAGLGVTREELESWQKLRS